MTISPIEKAQTLISSQEEIENLIRLGESRSVKYSVEDLFSRPDRFAFSISPNGKYLLFRCNEGGYNHVYIQDLQDTHSAPLCILQEGEQPIKGCGWINDDRIYYASDQGGDENYHLYACNPRGEERIDLTPYPDCRAMLLAVLKEDKEHIIVGINKNNPQLFEPYRLNIYTAELTLLYPNTREEEPIQDYLFDKWGRLRGFYQLEQGVFNSFYYYNETLGEFEKKITTSWDDSFDVLRFNYASSNPNEVYLLSNIDRDKTAILRYDLATMTVIEELFSHPTYDVSGLKLSRKRHYEIDAWSYDAERYCLVPISRFYRTMYKRLQEELPDKMHYVVDFDDEERVFLIFVESDTHYGSYYIYRPEEGTLEKFCALKPKLEDRFLAPMIPFVYPSSDGLNLQAYLTLPQEASSENPVPLIVIPHGGPQGVRDTWGFDSETQLFAQYGYASLQVNFRISGGYGKEFLQAGFGEIGAAVQRDLEEGIEYVTEHFPIDTHRIAVYGGSHGGYASLMALVRNSSKYRCGIDYVGVSSIETFFESFPEYWKPMRDIVKQIWYDVDTPEGLQRARERSPLLQIDRIQTPILVVQGANDPRVKLSESNQIVEALRSHGIYTPYVVKEDEGHGFYKESNRLEFYRIMIGFLSKML